MSNSSDQAAAAVGQRNYSLDDLVALNDEIIALVRSGVPLERGLLDARGDLRGRLGRLVEAVAKRVQSGESLDQAVASAEVNLPEVYSAIVRAGVRSGRLAIALEQLSVTARRIAEMRRIVAMAVMYPLVVALVGCSLFAFVGPQWARLMRMGQDVQRIELSAPAQLGVNLAEHLGPIVFWIPFLLLVGVLLWWWAVGRARSAQPAVSARWCRWLPGLGRLLHYSSAATFCEVLGLLVEHDVPLGEALPLAGAATGDRQMQADAKFLAEKIQSGQCIEAGDKSTKRIPALVRWMLCAGENQGRSVSAIRTAADDYHERAKHLVEWMRIFVPILLVLAIGATITIVFALTVFGPWTSFINNVAESVGRY